MASKILEPFVAHASRLVGRQLGITGWPQVPISNGSWEKLDGDIVHFPNQYFVVTSMPSIYNPHDLQHLHYPGNFRAGDLVIRDIRYREAFRFSQAIAVSSSWVKSDVMRQYGISPDKLQVIPLGPLLSGDCQPGSDSGETVLKKYGISVPYGLYPAMTWPHKNHDRLMRAVALLRDKMDFRVQIVCPGFHNEHWPKLDALRSVLCLEEQVDFPGFIPTRDLAVLYAHAQFVIVPSLFEAASGPAFEAWYARRPVACSNVTSLPQQVGDAALIFDPFSVNSIAEAIHRMSTDAQLRERLILKGCDRLQDFSWQRTAKAYRALYRRVGRKKLTDEDRWLLSLDWMADSNLSEES